MEVKSKGLRKKQSLTLKEKEILSIQLQLPKEETAISTTSDSGRSFGKKRKGGIGRIGGSPIIIGELDKSLIDAVIKRNMSQIRYCYQRQLSKNPTLNGTIQVKFVISKDGSVSKAAIDHSTMDGGTSVESCITGRFKRFRFPKPGAGIVIVKYPFVFSPG